MYEGASVEGLSVGSCEHANELDSFIKSEGFFFWPDGLL